MFDGKGFEQQLGKMGALVMYCVPGILNAAEGKPIDDIDGKQVLVSGVLGAVGGGVAAVVGKAAIGIAGVSKLGQPGTVVVEKTAEIIVDSGTSVVSTLVKGEKPLTFEGVAQDVIVGQLGGAFGKTVAKSKTPSSSAYIHAKSEADRAARMASPTKKNGSLRDIGRPKAKQAKANAANAAIKELIDGNATRGGIVEKKGVRSCFADYA